MEFRRVVFRSGKIQMKMTAEKGRGYRPAEANNHDDLPIGVIPVDSIFTPVSRATFQVENTRVGQITNFDKLTLDVWTDGSIRPEEAVSLGAKIFTEHLNLFVCLIDEAPKDEIRVVKEEE